ncbi:N-acetylmuramoyl-L-alanine amidase [Paenibacillus lignilyticus]|uniref:N-acetylmuramoyl-L-alanine amidase n=1 Tax=Paenibacillus lignilyticus TaxID=1172615 RepID=A0ABS5C6K5_9BACL|nr:N-acetylmuramoyl-L-alanine amidase [Paenibacillus lignilyticus]MBP3961085.1 N-acetylmuramoyl-L-alanine amidase [Paenibacillus lignilyticus]
MKKFVSAVLLLSLLISMFPSLVGAAEAPKLYLNGKQLQSAAEPRIVGDSTLVPIRTVTEGLGFDVAWEKPNVTISNGETNMVLTIGGKNAIVNDREVSLDAPALNTDGSTMVPLRFVSEQFGLSVYWDKLSRSVHLFQQTVVTPPVVDPPTETPDPGTDPGNGEGPVVDPPPTDSSASLKSIEYNGLGSIYLSYEGDFKDVKTEVLHNPERVVIDLPYMNFNSAFTPAFTQLNSATKLGEILIDSHPTLQKVRYSYYSDKPDTVRIVLDLLAPTNVQTVEEDQAIRIDVLEQTGPPPVTPPVTPGDKVYKVVLDAGHGAKDPGALSVNGRQEKEYNLAITLKVKALLDRETKIKPYLTRSNDTFVELDDRAAFANNLKADLFISFHANKTESATVTGSETYYSRGDSIALAKILHKYLVIGTGFKDRGVRQADFRVIKKTTMPAVLLEAGYLSNSGDSSVLFNDAKQNKIAAEIVAGIKEYLKLS